MKTNQAFPHQAPVNFGKTLYPGKIKSETELGPTWEEVTIMVNVWGGQLNINIHGLPYADIVNPINAVRKLKLNVDGGWNAALLIALLQIYKRYNNNAYRPGCPEQENFIALQEFPDTITTPDEYRKAATEALDKAGILIFNGHHYGKNFVHEALNSTTVFSLQLMPGERRIATPWGIR